MILPGDSQVDALISLESEIKTTFSKNLVLRLLLTAGYRWVGVAIGLAVTYFVIGIVISISTRSVLLFLQSRQVYVLLLAIVACVYYACWYPSLMIEVLIAAPRALKLYPRDLKKLVGQWMKYISVPIPFVVGFVFAVSGISLSIIRQTSLSVNRVETPAFQAGRFQHHNGISIDESCRCSTIAV